MQHLPARAVAMIYQRGKEMVRQKRRTEDREEEDQLAKKLFGSSAGFPDGFEDNGDDDDKVEGMFEEEIEVSKKPVWQDEDDIVEEAVVEVPLHHRRMQIKRVADALNQKLTPKEYEGRLRQLFCHSSGAAPAWSQSSCMFLILMSNFSEIETLDFVIRFAIFFYFDLEICGKKKTQHAESDDDDLQDALREITTFTGKCVTGSRSLTKSVISVKRMNNITRGHRFGKKPMRALQFHPTRKVLMCAGENGLLSLFEKSLFCYDLMDAKVMQMRTPYEMTKMHMGRFSLSSDGKYIAVLAYNEVHILTSVSSEYIGVLTTSAKIASVQFFPNDSSTIFTLGENGQVLIWNIRKLKEQQAFYDEGSVKGTVIRISENGQYIACGSNTGIVNLYDSADVLKNSLPRPVKALDNLTTSIDCMAFNSDSQILSVSSSVKNNSIRLMHVGSRTVYTNFPPRAVSLGKVTVTDFSPKSAYMGVGDDRGFLSLFRLSHFTTY
uniref:WD_REPEATS_REGION domain-containing protein n=1 Tax=Wuchereria bancrofti TaxID=6293 RepID=A0A1I8EE72_WUCBA